MSSGAPSPDKPDLLPAGEPSLGCDGGGAGGGGEEKPRSSSSLSSSEYSSSSSSSGADSRGFSRIDGRLRSVLSHPAGLPLACFFSNSDGGCQAGDPRYGGCAEDIFLSRTLKAKFDLVKESKGFEEVFRSGYEQWRSTARVQRIDKRPSNALAEDEQQPRSERKLATPKLSSRGLASALHDGMSSELDGADSVEAVLRHPQRGPRRFHGGNKLHCLADPPLLLVSRKPLSDMQGKSVVLLLEVGIDKGWWTAADRAVSRVKSLPVDTDAADCSDGTAVVFTEGTAMILTVLTISTREEGHCPGGDDLAFASARLGVFLCTRPFAKHGSVRMSLLWRKESDNLLETSKAIGKTLRAACLLPDLLDVVDRQGYDFECLGPNCCHRSGRVYRAYDTRFRYTPRRPDLYAKFAPPKGDGCAEPDVSVVCRIRDYDDGDDDVDEDASRGDGVGVGAMEITMRDHRPRVTDVIDRMNWMWTMQGELVVISIPFVEGNHFASTIEDFIPVVRALQRMHEEGYVHGDIRCFNIVFGKGLIDFDFGGRIESAKYPPKYNIYILDGRRLGSAGETITKWHDWYALIDVIFRLHDLQYPEHECFEKRYNHYRLQHARRDDVEKLAMNLESFLLDVKDTWTVMLDSMFQALLQECGLLVGETAETSDQHPPVPGDGNSHAEPAR